MFGLFDPPDVAIAKRLPPQMKMEYIAVLTYVDMACNTESKNKKKASSMRGFVGSVWAFNSVKSGKFTLSDFDLRYIKNLGINYSKLLDKFEFSQCEYAIEQLIQKGFIA